jgi:hypothetical protein
LSEWVGWLATAVFVGSYFVRPSRLLVVQVAGALTWLAYGLLTSQPPVIVSNVVVAGAAAFRVLAPRLAVRRVCLEPRPTD